MRKNRNLTPEEAKKLEQLGFKLEVTYKNKCILCGKKFTSKNEERLVKKLEKHVNEKCTVAKWMKSAFNILRIVGLKNVIMSDLLYLQEGRFPEGHGRTKPEELEILDNVKHMMDNWRKKETEDE